MEKIVHYIGLDVHKESDAVSVTPQETVKETDILAALPPSREAMVDRLPGRAGK